MRGTERLIEAGGHEGEGQLLLLRDFGPWDIKCLASGQGEGDAVRILRDPNGGEFAPVFLFDGVANVLGIDGGAGLADVAQHAVVVAVDEVGQIGADFAALAAHGVAHGADAFEERLAIVPISSRELRQVFVARHRRDLLSHGIRQQNATQRERTQRVAAVGEPACFQVGIATCRFKRHGEPEPASGFGADLLPCFVARACGLRDDAVLAERELERTRGIEHERHLFLGIVPV